MLYIFQTIAPILTYGSDVWGINKSAKVSTDRMFLKCAKSALGVKYNTSNVMVYGECNSVTCDINVICFYNRLKNMSSNRLARIVLNELEYLHHNGFRTWVTDVLHLSQTYGVENFDMDYNSFKTHCKELVRRKFIESWKCELNDLDKNPILRMYKLIKTNFSMEPYLNLIKKPNTDGRLQNYASALIVWKSSEGGIRNQWPLLSKDYVSRVVLLMTNCIF